jgi:hypothetical protein
MVRFHDVRADNAQNKRLDCPQLQCMVTGLTLRSFFNPIFPQAPVGAESVEILRVVG